ncbi:helix-turn-helix domain-containing protein [Actinoplanes sp. NPDC051859]|uniref:helix-turn-helix domain-containing protein n=1 Tax=Actinoplanes sp. NPDC051859 TaxID=3363909 RepID=UPI0037876099
MAPGLATLTGGQGSRSTGFVSGFVLKLARESAALTQENLAEELGVGVDALQGWESGRRPLSAINAGQFLTLCARLARLGAPASTGRHLLEAIEADQVLSTGVAAGARWVDSVSHPLANSVHRWAITNLITWPVAGVMPQHLAVFVRRTARRGPVPAQPCLGAEERTRFFDHLQVVVARADNRREALLRRQAVYLLGFDRRPEIADWLRSEWSRAIRRPVDPGNLTGLLEARSASVALAIAGDCAHLQDFVDRATGDRADVANLNYWAYWIGELGEPQINDDFMLDADTRSWVGVRLLRHLVKRLQPESLQLPLNISTLHSLIASRPALLSGPPEVRTTLTKILDELTSVAEMSRTSLDQIAGIRYAVRMAER